MLYATRSCRRMTDLSISSTIGLTNPSASWAPKPTPRRRLGDVSFPRLLCAMLPMPACQSRVRLRG